MNAGHCTLGASAAGLLFFLCLSGNFPAWAEAQTGGIAGLVVDQRTGQPLAGANVEILGPPLARQAGAVCNTEGHYAIEAVPPGVYKVKASFIGYLDGMAEGIQVSAGEFAEVNFHLLASPYRLETTVVSASRQAESIVDATASISKVEGEQSRRNAAGYSYISDLKHVSGVHYTRSGLFDERFSARGFNSAFNTRMLLIADGRVTRTFAGNPLFGQLLPKDDLQDAEVVVGPGSALYGPDATAGVVSLTSRDPRTSQGTIFAVSAGTREQFAGRFRHAGAAARWGWKLSGGLSRGREYEQINTFYSPDSSAAVTDDPDFDARALLGAVGLYYYPDIRSKVSLTVGSSRSSRIFFSNLGRDQVIDYTYNYQHLAYTSPGLYLSFYNTGDDQGDTFVLDQRAQFQLSGLSRQEAEEAVRRSGEWSFQETELRYRCQAPFPKKTQVILGALYRRDDSTSNLLENGGATVGLLGFQGLAQSQLDDRVWLVLAARIDLHEIYGMQSSPKAALVVKPRPEMALQASFNRAFKSPTVLEQKALFYFSPTVVGRGNSKGFQFATADGSPLPPQYAGGIPRLEPEENTTFALGFKGILAERVYLDLSAYHSRYRNFISSPLPVGDPANGIVTADENGAPRAGEVTLTILNFGRQNVLGADLGLKVRAAGRLTLTGNGSFIKARSLEKAVTGAAQPFNTPGSVVNAGLQIAEAWFPDTYLDLFLRYVEEYDFRSGPHAGTVPRFAVFDLNAGYQSGAGLTYRISIQNLLDHRHREFVTGPRIGRIVVGEIQYGF